MHITRCRAETHINGRRRWHVTLNPVTKKKTVCWIEAFQKRAPEGEQEEFERLLREVEAEIAANAAAKKGSAAAASEMATISAESATPSAEEVAEAIADPKTGEAPAAPATE